MTSETGPDPGAASSARDEAVRVIVAAIAAAPWASEGEGASSYVRAGVDALIARPDVLAALAAEAGLVVLDPRLELDWSRLSSAVWESGSGAVSPYGAAVALDRLAEELTR